MIIFVIKTNISIIKYFIQGRHKNCSVIYLSQSYYKTDKNIRLNCDHFILYEMNSVREESMLTREIGMPIDKYKEATKNQYHFLYMDLTNLIKGILLNLYKVNLI